MWWWMEFGMECSAKYSDIAGLRQVAHAGVDQLIRSALSRFSQLSCEYAVIMVMVNGDASVLPCYLSPRRFQESGCSARGHWHPSKRMVAIIEHWHTCPWASHCPMRTITGVAPGLGDIITKLSATEISVLCCAY